MFSFRQLFILLLSLAAVSAAAPSMEPEARHKCFKGVFMIIGHGSNEVGKASMGVVSDAVQQRIPDSHTVAIHYPSTLNNYPHSEGKGVHKMKQQIRNYVNLCGHKSKIMLLGYSQGAQVITNTLSGGTFAGYGVKSEYSTPLADEFSKYILAILQFGDPSFTAGKPWDAGTSKTSGLVSLSTDQLHILKTYEKILRSYCDKLDPYCASGVKNQTGYDVHGSYVSKYADVATDWLVRKWNKEEE